MERLTSLGMTFQRRHLKKKEKNAPICQLLFFPHFPVKVIAGIAPLQ
uniref:Uncharacterized protein n=1 Tax=Rhizophora mucronata TaxID=61149 RepID=A0A2P2P7H7_RHIMU